MEEQKKQAEWFRDRRGELYCSACGAYEPFGETNFCPNCGLPMKRLPEQPVKHIDRLALICELKDLKVQAGSLACLGCGYENNCSIYGCAIINEAIRQLEEKKPVVHAHWETAIGYDPKKPFQCSNCRKMHYQMDEYCPHCGAEMDGEAE